MDAIQWRVWRWWCVIGLAVWAGDSGWSATVTGFSPDRGGPGTEVTVFGSGLQTTAFVFFGSTEAAGEILAVGATSVRVRVPPNALTGQVSVFTTGSGSASSAAIFVAAPRVTEFNPVTGGPGTLVTISGANFGTGQAGSRGRVTSVTFNGQPAAFEVSGINQLVTVVPANATSGPLTLVNEAGSFSTLLPFQVPALLAGFAPARGMPGEAIEIRGSNLGSTLRVDIGLIPAAFVIGSASNLVAYVPTNAIDGRVQVTTPAGATSTSTNFLVLPRIIQFAPAFGPVGTTVVLEGGGFRGVTEVQIGGVRAAFNAPSSTRVEAVVPSGAVTGPIRLTTPNGVFETEADFHLPPQLTGYTPGSGTRGTVVTVDGRNLARATRVTINGVEATFTVVSATRLSVTVPPLATTGRLRVETPGGAAESSGTFTVRPVLDGFSPGSGSAGSVVNLQGAGLTNVAVVRLGDLDATFTVVNSTQVRVIVPLNAFSGPFYLRTANGLESTAPGNFFVEGAQPSITELSPTNGPVGTSVTLKGAGLRTAAKVEFNGKAAVHTVLSSSEVRATVPEGATTGRVAVTTLDGIAVSPVDFVIPEVAVRLAIERTDSGLMLSWPQAAAAYQPEATPVLGAGAAWETLTGTPTSDGSRWRLAVPLPADGARYFRLRR